MLCSHDRGAITKRHACHAKCRGTRQTQAPPQPAQCHKCHACHTKCRSMSPSATPATQSEGRCHQVPRLPRKVKVDVTKRHACHAKCRGARQTHAPPQPAQCHKCRASHTKCRSMSPSATPATQSEGRCHQVPRLPRKVKVDVTKRHACHAKCRGAHQTQAPPQPAQCHKCHACHTKCRSMSPSATLATQSEGRCHQVPRLPRKVKVDVTKCHACHAKWRSMSPSATPATQSEGRCHQVPHLPRKVKVDVTKRHVCHAK